MKQLRSKANAVRVERMARTTVVLPEPLNLNLDFLALKNGTAKGELIREALAEYLKNRGLMPELVPSIAISYEEGRNGG